MKISKFRPFRDFYARLALWLALLLAVPLAHAAPPNVVVSILPLHSLVSAIMRDVGEARLLLDAGQSPHASQLKPSQVKALSNADLIVWVGAALERALDKTIANKSQRATSVITLLENNEVMLLPTRQSGVWSQHEHKHEHEHESTFQTHAVDPHLWLSFANAEAIIRIVTRELVRLDATNRERYHANARDLLARLARLHESLRQRLHAMDTPYVVFHDAYHYFEDEFDLRPAGSLTLSPDRLPGAKRIREIKQLIDSRNVRCVFSEPQFQPGLVHTLIADTNATAAILDPLGATLTPGPDAWFELLEGIADSLVNCLR